MTLKLNHSQFTALLSILHQIVTVEGEPASMEAKLLLSIIASIYKKLFTKSIEKKKKYSLKLTATEALAFWVFFSKYHFFEGEALFEAHLVQTINNTIHQKFA